MITISVKKTKRGFLDVKLVWDGRQDNDLLAAETAYMPHPFCQSNDYEDMKTTDPAGAENLREVGEVVADNEVCRAIIDLLSNEEKLKISAGSVDPYWYRMKLIGALSKLWD